MVGISYDITEQTETARRQALLTDELNGNAEIDFRPEGVVCIIRFAPADLAAIDHEGHRHD
jgi:hypothetical protein